MSSLLDRVRFRRDHRWAPERMSDYLDGELAPRRRARMEHHLSRCDECRRLLAGLRRTVDALRRFCAPTSGLDPLVLAESVRVRLSRSD